MKPNRGLFFIAEDMYGKFPQLWAFDSDVHMSIVLNCGTERWWRLD
jgi:hypothetical protein